MPPVHKYLTFSMFLLGTDTLIKGGGLKLILFDPSILP
jgi:hypothetical protein